MTRAAVAVAPAWDGGRVARGHSACSERPGATRASCRPTRYGISWADVASTNRRALAEYHADTLSDLLAAAMRHHTKDFEVAATGDKNASQHLDRGRFTSPVRTQAAHHLAPLDSERNIPYRADRAVLAMHQRAQRAKQPGAV